MLKYFPLALLAPTQQAACVTDICPGRLLLSNIKAVIIDKDGTIMVNGEIKIRPDIRIWFDEMRQCNLEIIIASNSGFVGRVRAVSKELGVKYTICGPAWIYGKPWPRAFRKAIRILNKNKNIPPHQIAVIGDQLTTDIWGGNLIGCHTILVKPLENKDRFLTSLLIRPIEKIIIRWLYLKGLIPSPTDD